MGLTRCKIFGKILHLLLFVIFITIDPSPAKPDQDDEEGIMIKITDTVLEIIQTDEIASEALRTGLLNLSAYADKIHKNVENATKKPVKRGTIVVALSRITKHLPNAAALIQDVSLTNIGIKSSLTILTYKKSIDTQRKISVMNPFLLPINDLFSVTEGPEEITIICSDRSKDIILKNICSKPKTKIK